MSTGDHLRNRVSPLDLEPEEFRELGHELVDRIADFLDSLPTRPLTPGESASTVQLALRADSPLPQQGSPPGPLLEEAARLLFDHSLFSGHPRYWGYIHSPGSPIGALGDLLAASVNPNLAAWVLSPIATEIELQTVRWIAELLGYPTSCGGLLVSGGNVANFVGVLVARRAGLPWDVRAAGVREGAERPRIYASAETHTWLTKAADLFGFGTEAVRWIPAGADLRLDLAALESQLDADIAAGDLPLVVVGTAGSVSTGAIDPLPAMAAICRERGLWFHVDGAYGALAACLPDAPADLAGLAEADSVAVDPHKWLYAPLEAGCALVRNPTALQATFGGRPAYYHLAEEDGADARTNLFEWGPQNSRGFRALKVWLGLRQVGREGYVRMISDDIALAAELFRLVDAEPELEACTNDLSITTFRYVPPGLEPGDEQVEAYLNDLNTELLGRLESGGEVFLSNAVIGGRFLLRACIVNFRTRLDDIEALPAIVKRIGAEVDAELRPAPLRAVAHGS